MSVKSDVTVGQVNYSGGIHTETVWCIERIGGGFGLLRTSSCNMAFLPSE